MAPRCPHHAIAQPAVCEACARAAAAVRHGRRRLLVGLALLVPLGALVAYLQSRKPAVPARPAAHEDAVLRLEAERLAKAPCDVQTLTERVERFVDLGRTAEGLATAYRAFGCGARGRLPWRIVYLDEQLHRWFPAVVMATQLIDETPDDSDFWWWRAEAFADGGLPKLAVNDDRQSLANSDDAQAAGFAAVRIGAPATAAVEPCEADRAWRYFVRVIGGVPNQDMRDDHAALERAGTCAKQEGSGAGRLAGRVRVAIGGVTGTFEVDPHAGATAISRMFAARLGVESDPHRLGTALVHGQPALGELIRLDGVAAGPVRASGVDALVVDDLPADGVLGLSFFWHFAVEFDGDAIRLAPSKPGPL